MPNFDSFHVDRPPAPSPINGSPLQTANDLARRGGMLHFTLPPDASDEERAAERAYLEDVAEALNALGRTAQVNRRRWRSGWEEATLTC